MTTEFDDIRPFNDAEAAAALAGISAHPMMSSISKFLFPEADPGKLSGILATAKGVDDFQIRVMDPAVRRILETSTTAFTTGGIERLQAEGPGCRHLYLSNHRDIVLDPAFTQEVLFQNGLPTTEICVGDNLLSDPAVEALIRSNRMVKVTRGVQGRELYNALSKLSRYIRESVTTGRSSVWLAQRQGRTKDGRDTTEEALLKMLGMSGDPADFAGAFKELRIVPLSISYQFESCDLLKAIERLRKRSGIPYVKQPGEDLNSIVTGILQPKGKVHLEFCAPLTDEEIETTAARPRPERYLGLCEVLNARILGSYRLWDTNYRAWDLLHGEARFAAYYSPEEAARFDVYLAHQLGRAPKELPSETLRELFLEIYAHPVDQCHR